MPRIDFTSIIDKEEIRNYPWEEVLNQTEYWMDRYGDLHRITEMDTDYLKNILRFIRGGARQVENAIWFCLGTMRGEMALYEAEKDLGRYMEWQELPLYEAVIEELRQRGIEVTYHGV